MSLGSLSPDATMHAACDYAYTNNKLLIASSGNDASNITRYPANYSSVVAVGATGVNTSTYVNTFASSYSNYGIKQEVSAPGGNADGSMWEIWSTYPSNSYNYLSGTSMSAPMVTGLASLMFDVMPTLTNVEARTLLQQSVFDLGTIGRDDYYGYGMICGWCAVYNAQHFCAIPTGLAATSITTTSAILNWNAATGVVSYSVRYRPASSSTWATVVASYTSITISGLIPNTAYVFQVRTTCASDISGYSASGNFTTLINCPAPTSSSLNATSITTTSASLSWATVPTAISYNVQYRIGTTGAWSLPNNVITTSYVLSGLLPNTLYQFRVQSVCGISTTSAYTTPFNFTTLEETIPIDHTGIDGVSINAVAKVYPNPITRMFYVEVLLPNKANMEISLVDVNGKDVMKLYSGMGQIGNNNLSFDKPNVPSGNYFLSIKVNSQTIKNQKIIVN